MVAEESTASQLAAKRLILVVEPTTKLQVNVEAEAANRDKLKAKLLPVTLLTLSIASRIFGVAANAVVKVGETDPVLFVTEVVSVETPK